MKKLILEDDHRCFACGKDNPEGLRIAWKVEGMVMTAEYIPDHKYQGWKGILHGGIAATLLDEAMTRLAGIVFGGAVTAEMTVRYVHPIPIGQKILIRGEIVKDVKKIVEMRAILSDLSGKILAHSNGKAIKVR